MTDDPITLRLGVSPGDCLEVMKELPDNSIDSVVTDPPYGLAFMSKAWDHAVPGVEYWAEVLRVAKPGAHLVAFGGTRTYHRLTCAIEDAGWEIRDCLSWLYGSGFPKSLDVSKAVDSQSMLGSSNSRYLKQVNALRPGEGRVRSSTVNNGHKAWVGESNGGSKVTRDEPATVEGAAWRGWGTALKPAWEPIILARKPLVGTVAQNVLEHSTGGLNIDACRIAGENPSVARRETARRTGHAPIDGATAAESTAAGRINRRGSAEVYMQERAGELLGRWPANVVLDEEAAELLDEQTGVLTSGTMKAGQQRQKSKGKGGYHGDFPDEATSTDTYGDSGGASRFFYCAKASRSERTHKGKVDNTHPTVKPLALMQWLVKLVTPKEGVVLDPFCGSGSTGVAALREGFDFIGIEKEEDSVRIAQERIKLTYEEVKGSR